MAERTPIRLGVNVDHVATIRNARGGYHPDPVRAARAAIAAGAHGITAHLREDRRHIVDLDVERLMKEIDAPLNLEMAATDEMIGIAHRLMPHAVCLVPEKRTERTTEGGLDVIAGGEKLRDAVKALSAHSRVSLFIAPDTGQIEASAKARAAVIELHTGTWCEAVMNSDERGAVEEFKRLVEGAQLAASLGLEVHAGHGLDFDTAELIATLPEIAELNIGHYMMGEAIFVGLDAVIKNMLAAMARGRARSGATA
ncbi:MAG: pyridoxine 5'-phosphate synthase [Xanthobacteraceae bacterium]|nr:pyridoxine 5'-phosphate synthase [Xanthobacteraceae bacterium]